MKLLSAKLTAFFSVFALSVSYGQAPDGTTFAWKQKVFSSAPSAQDMNLQMVETILQEGNPALTVGTFHLRQMGDDAAVSMIKIFGMRKTITPTDADLITALTIMEKAFEEPTYIAKPADRQPRATLFLLQMLELSTVEMKDQIAQTRQRIETSLEKANASSGK